MKLKFLALGAVAALASCNEPVEEDKYVAFELTALDTTVSPCDNFFNYTSGGWIAANPIPETENRWGRFDELAENNRKRIRGAW